MFGNITVENVVSVNKQSVVLLTQEDVDNFLEWLDKTPDECGQELNFLAESKLNRLEIGVEYDKYEIFKYLTAIKMGYLLAHLGELDANKT